MKSKFLAKLNILNLKANKTKLLKRVEEWLN